MIPSSPYSLSPRRPHSPPLRAPSPLGQASLILHADGSFVPIPPYRCSTAPAGWISAPPLQRPSSPNSGSPPLRPPLLVAQSISRQELQKINCDELQFRLGNVLVEFQKQALALRAIQTKISRSWTVPQRAVRGRMKLIIEQFTTNATYLSQYLSSMAIASRQILHFIATCIRETHGLTDFNHVQDLKPVIDELRLLHTQWAALTRASEVFGETLSNATMLFEEAMDPDHWVPTSSLSLETTSLASSHNALTLAFSQVSTFLHSLAITEWQPPLLSPNDVKLAAGQWRDVERVGAQAAKEVRGPVKGVLEGAVVCAFVAREEAERVWKAFGEGLVVVGGTLPRPFAPVLQGPSMMGMMVVDGEGEQGRVEGADQKSMGIDTVGSMDAAIALDPTSTTEPLPPPITKTHENQEGEDTEDKETSMQAAAAAVAAAIVGESILRPLSTAPSFR
ncbi:BQ2448_4000 [Microbotryum intermedium]|uniref:BQ2448_4000 protein n=1 Tax=Microbotryum intermedium TaxID=269621 RepID=A0A238FKD7_9BASI|nr:BQ2448_4000 [Microbotryum intermedium]